MLYLQDHWSSGNQWGDCTCLIVPQLQNQQCCFYRTTDPLVISEVTVHVWLSHFDNTNNVAFTGPLILRLSVRWLYMFDCLTVTKPTMLLLQDRWSTGNQWGDCTGLIFSQWHNKQCCFYRTTGPLVISEVTVHVWLSHIVKTNTVAFTGPLILRLSVRWLYMFDCLTVIKPTMLLLQDRWSTGNQWGDCTGLIVSQWHNKQCCFYRTTGPLVISEVTVHVWLSHSDKTYTVAFTGPLVLWSSLRWLYMFDCPTVTKPTILLLKDHWSSGNQWSDCTCLIVSQWENQQYCFYRTTGPLVISEVTVHVWLSHSDKTNVVVSTEPLVLWLSVRWLYLFDCLTVTKLTMLLLRATGPLVIRELTVHVWLSHSDKTKQCCFLQDHWSYGNQWVDSTCLIVSQWQNQQYAFTGSLVLW